jgi:hypothetical protein
VVAEMNRTNREVNNDNSPECSFSLQIQFRQNASWQGRIIWMEEKKTVTFRSLLELLVLLEEALGEKNPSDFGNIVNWEQKKEVS